MTEETRDYLLQPMNELIRDPMYLHARVQEILAEAREYGAQYPYPERHRHEAAALASRLEILDADLLVHGPTGDEVLAAVERAVPELSWHRCNGIYAYAATDDQAERAAGVLALAENDHRPNGKRLWKADRDGIEVNVYGPAKVQESGR